MHIYKVYEEQKLSTTIDDAWDFFSRPENLAKITPADMKFTITNSPGKDIYTGMIITYKVRPLFDISLNWITEIVYADKPYYFIDEQRFGPYKFWHHRHSFTEISGGVLMKDEVYYALPLGIIGQIMHSVLIKNKIEEIFTHRREILKKMFSDGTNTGAV